MAEDARLNAACMSAPDMLNRRKKLQKQNSCDANQPQISTTDKAYAAAKWCLWSAAVFREMLKYHPHAVDFEQNELLSYEMHSVMNMVKWKASYYYCRVRLLGCRVKCYRSICPSYFALKMFICMTYK